MFKGRQVFCQSLFSVMLSTRLYKYSVQQVFVVFCQACMLMWLADTKVQNQCLLSLSELMLMTLVRLYLALGFYRDIVIWLFILLSLSLTESKTLTCYLILSAILYPNMIFMVYGSHLSLLSYYELHI